jgi:hypothetical protein
MMNQNGMTNPFLLDPMAFWKRMFDESQGRIDGMFDEVGKRQTMAVEQTHEAMNEVVKLYQGQLGFASSLSKEWLEMVKGASKWAGDFMGGLGRS